MKLRLMAKHFAFARGLRIQATRDDGEWLVGGPRKRLTDRQVEKLNVEIEKLRTTTSERLTAQAGEEVN